MVDRRCLFLIAQLAQGSVALGAALGSPEPSGEFLLQLGSATHELKLDVTSTITLPTGPTATVILRRRPILHFSAQGVSFDHPHEMKVSVDSSLGFTTIHVEATESPLATIQVMPTGTDPETFRKEMASGIVNEYSSRGCKVKDGSRKAVRRSLGGSERTGEALELDMMGETFRLEAFAFRRADGSVVGLLMLHDRDDEALATRFFPVICNSLR